jgi:hypothetical protein
LSRALPAAVALALAACRPATAPEGSIAEPQRGRGQAPPPGSTPPAHPAPQRMAAHTLDVGQGAATLFELPCAAVLVDTGGE